MDFNFVIAFIGGIFGGTLFCVASKYLERETAKRKAHNASDTENNLLSQYNYAIARVYESKNDCGFSTITVIPILMCEDEESAVNGAKEQREYEKQVALSNPTSNMIDYFSNIRAIKIYGVD